MDLNKFTEKSQQALADAQSLATARSHQELDDAHLLRALLEDGDGLAPRLFGKLNVPTADCIAELDSMLKIQPAEEPHFWHRHTEAATVRGSRSTIRFGWL